jgi:aspartokinase/homoserine dehydrogenase 1
MRCARRAKASDAALAAEDAVWRERLAETRAPASAGHAGARRSGRCLHRPARVAAGLAVRGAAAGQNLLHVRTRLQDATPLVLGGPGAGPAVTAAGVLSDIVAAAAELASRR